MINCGSSSLKFDLVELREDRQGEPQRLAYGLVDRIGLDHPAIELHAGEKQSEIEPAGVKDHRDATERVFAWLKKTPGPDGRTLGDGIQAAGHRVVHGGDRFTDPTLVDDEVIQALETLSELAPLHNPPALQGIRATRDVLGPSVPMVAVFDTAFHSTMPEYATRYAIPDDLSSKYGIKRYGFHGIAHADMLERYSQLAGVPAGSATIITLQLGNGCSACAIRNGKSVDTSMGFTPLEGLVMGTRSGDLDPGILGYLADKERVTVDTVESWLNHKSGLLGISDRSSDMRDLISAMKDNPLARLAVEVFCYRVRKYIGAYLAVLDGAQAVIFGGGIGEHAPLIRERICEGLESAGLVLDPELNSAVTNSDGRISAAQSKLGAFVISVDESLLIARFTRDRVLKA